MSFKHKMSIQELYDMMPYERDIFIDLIVEDIEKNMEE